MWLVTCRSPMLSRRNGQIGPGRIDTFFDEWLPTIVNEVRRLARGAEYAASMHQEVVSKDGLSRPAATVGMDSLAADAPPAHKELKRAAAKKRSRGQVSKALEPSGYSTSAANRRASCTASPSANGLASRPNQRLFGNLDQNSSGSQHPSHHFTLLTKSNTACDCLPADR